MDAERLESRNEAATLSLDFKVIDMFVFCVIGGKKKRKTLWVLAYNPVCVELRPSFCLLPVRQSLDGALILFICHKKENSRRGGAEIGCSFVSAVSSLSV